MLRVTGYPLVDVGAATIAAFNRKRDIGSVTTEDLDAMADFIQEYYIREPLKSFLTTIFPNAGYVNPTMGAEKRVQEIQRCLYGYRRPAPDAASPCIFCGRPACDVVFRQHIPLTAGEGIMNMGPGGSAGLSVCGACLLCIQAFPLGSVTRCSGRVLVVHSDNPDLTCLFAATFLEQNRRALTLSTGTESKVGNPKTIIIEALVQIDDTHRGELSDMQEEQGEISGSLTAYHLTNYGTKADITIYYLPSQIVRFLRAARGQKHRTVWNRLVARAWRQRRGADRGSEEPDGNGWFGLRRNALYEDLFESPINIARFVRGSFLPYARAVIEGAGTNNRQDNAMPWGVVDLFLREVTLMDKDRIGRIKQLGDRLAAYIVAENDRRFLKSLYGKRSGYAGYSDFRTALLKISTQQVKSGKEPVISFDDFAGVFEEGDDAPRIDWALARDLVYMRVLDSLYAQGWFMQHPEAAEEIAERVEEVSAGIEEEAAS